MRRGRGYIAASQGPEEKEVHHLLAPAAEVVLDAGGDVSAIDRQVFTPLDHAVADNREELADLLRQHAGIEWCVFLPTGLLSGII